MAKPDMIVFVEEASASEIVRAVARKLNLLPRITILKHQGAGDLERSIANKIANDPFSNTKFLVLRDADNQNCKQLKEKLFAMVPTKKRARTRIRIVCQELEAWYLAQPKALQLAKVLESPVPKKNLAANVDNIVNPKKLFLRHAHNKGQIEHARRIGEHLDIDSQVSNILLGA